MGNGPHCQCRCLTSELAAGETDDAPVHNGHCSWIRNKDGLLEKSGEDGSTGNETSTTRAGSKVDDEYSDSENSAGGFTPKRVLPTSSGKVSPVPKLVLPKHAFRDNGFKNPRSGGGGRGNGLTTKDWAADQAQFGNLPALPPGWIRVRSRSTGSIYYCFTATGETTFEEPKGSGSPLVGANATQQQDSSLPLGWHRMISRSTGRTYYWNSRLNQAQFEHPLDTGNSETQVADPLSSDLPHGWVKLISRTTGRPYYFNEKLHVSQFEHPSQGIRSPDDTIPEGKDQETDVNRDKDQQAENTGPA